MRAYNAYIDERGEEGWKNVGRQRFGESATSEWFILAGVLCHAEQDDEQTECVNEMRRLLNRTQTTKPLHWRELKSHNKKQVAANLMGKQQGLIYCVVALWKPPLAEQAPGLRAKGYLYNYAGKWLTERLTRFAWRRKASRQANLYWEQRESTSYDDLAGYLRTQEGIEDSGIDEGSLGEIKPVDGQTKGCQLADFLAGAVGNALEPNSNGNMTTDYLQRMFPRIWRQPNKELSACGFKVWPETALEREEYAWIRDL